MVGLGVSEFVKCESLPVRPFLCASKSGVSWVRLLDRACHLYSRNLSSTAAPAEERKRANNRETNPYNTFAALCAWPNFYDPKSTEFIIVLMAG